MSIPAIDLVAAPAPARHQAGLREVALLVAVVVMACLVWLPRVPSMTDAVSVAVLALVCLGDLARSGATICIGWPQLLLAMFVAVRAFALWNQPEELGGVKSVVSLVVALGVYVCAAVPEEGTIMARRALRTFALSASLAAIAYLVLTRSSGTWNSYAIYTEMLSNSVNRNAFGEMLALAPVVAAVQCRDSTSRRPQRLGWFLLAIFALLFLLVLGSRLSLAMAVFGLFVFVVVWRPRNLLWLVPVCVGVLPVLSRASTWILPHAADVLVTLQRVVTLLQAVISGDSTQIAVASAGRVPIWQAALVVFARSPVFGVGSGNERTLMLQQLGSYSYAHSTLLMLLSESGLLGACLYYAMFVTLSWPVVWLTRSPDQRVRNVAIAISACEATILFGGVFGVTGMDNIGFLILGLGAALVGDNRRQRPGRCVPGRSQGTRGPATPGSVRGG